MPPFVHVNCAITLDGCMGGPGRSRLRLSNEEDKTRVHRLRAEMDAILVGVGTVVSDDPKLTVRWERVGPAGPNPLRVVLDPHLRAPKASRVFDATAPTLTFALKGGSSRDNGVESVAEASDGSMDLEAVLERLLRRGVKRLLVEGGANTLRRFFAADLVDRATVFVSPQVLGASEAPRLMDGPLDLRPQMRLESAGVLGDGALLTFEKIR